MTFRPLLWPTLFAIFALIILVALGNWQMARLEWKDALIAGVERGLAAEPAPIPAPESWSDINLADLRYTHATATGRFNHDAEIHIYMPSLDGEPGYHVVTPFEMTSSGWLLVDRGFVPINRKDAATRAAGQVVGEVSVSGILVSPDEANAFTPEPDLAANIWYHRPIAEIAQVVGISPVFPLMLDADAAPGRGQLPIGGQTRIELENPHLGYALTWYGLAGTLIAIWLALHISRGRFRLN